MRSWFLVLTLCITGMLSAQHVGIGTTVPDELLHIKNGNVRFETSGFEYFDFTCTNVTGLRFKNAGVLDGGIWYNPASGLLNISDGSSSSGLVVNFQTRSVGVQISPQDPLHVKNAIRIDGSSGALKFFSGMTDKGYLTHSGTEMRLFNRFSAKLVLGTDDTPRLTIDNTGDVGIGTLDPSDKLHITSGDVRIDNADPGIKFFTDATAKASMAQMADTLYLTNHRKGNLVLGTDNASRLTIDTAGRVGIGTTKPFAQLDVRGGVRMEDVNPMFRMHNNGAFSMYMQHFNDDLFLSNVHSGNMTFKTANTDRMTIDATGKVGIGTTAPADPLHVLGDLRLQNGSVQLYNANILRGYLKYFGSDLVLNNDTSDGKMHFKCGFFERLTIAPNGNVGIGETDPQDRLHVNGDLRLDYPTPSIDFFDGATHKAGIKYSSSNFDITTSQAADAMRFRTNNQNRMVIHPDGKLSIGTTVAASNELLHLNGSMRLTSLNPTINFYQDGSTQAFLQRTSSSHTTLGSQGDLSLAVFSGEISFSTSDGPISVQRMVIDSFGKLGLGINQPEAVLDVVGDNNWNLTSTEGDFRLGNGANRIKMGVALDGVGAGTGRIYAAGTTDRLILGAGTSDVIAIEGSGEVGIGTNTPSHPLHMASGAHVTTGGVWMNASDSSRKYDVTDLDYGLDILMRLRPVHYRYKADSSQSIGFIAQEVEALIPEVVSGEEGSKAIAYGLLTSVLVNAVRELSDRNDRQSKLLIAQRNEINALVRENTDLGDRLSLLDSRIRRLEKGNDKFVEASGHNK